MKISTLKDSSILLLLIGKFTSLIGSQIQSLALSLYVLEITGSASKFAFVTMASIIPRIFIEPLGGVLADWLDKKKVIVYTDFMSGLVTLVFALIFRADDSLSLEVICILTIIITIISSIFLPSASAIIPSIAKKEDLIDVNSADSIVTSFANIIAPAIAGILFSMFGIRVILIINAVSFILSAMSESFIKVSKVNKNNDKKNISSLCEDFKEGIIFIKRNDTILSMIILAFLINFALNPIIVLGVMYVGKQVLLISDIQYGTLQSIVMVAMTASPLLVSKLCGKYKFGQILISSTLIASLFTGVIAIISTSAFINLFETNFIPYISMIIVAFIISALISIANIILVSSIQQNVSLDIIGRVNSVMSTGSIAAVPLGQMILGFLFDVFEAWIGLLLGMIFLIISISLCKKTILG